MAKPFFEAEASSAGDSLELRMYGPVGSRWDGGITAQLVSDALKNAPSVKHITVRMSSPGGAAYEGVTISNIFKAHSAHVTGIVEGLAASAMSIIAMGCDVIKMHEGSSMMIHGASTWTEGDIDEHEKSISALKVLNSGMASMYSSRTGKTQEECAALMKAETWLTPDNAVSNRFANEVIKGKASATAFAFDLTEFGYQHVPAELAAFTAQAQRSVLANHAMTSLTEKKETPNMTINFARVAQAVGLAPDAEEAAVLSALGKIANVMSELRIVTAAESNDGILGAVRGFAESHKALPAAQAQLIAQAKTLEASERAALLAADASDAKGRKLTPAMVAFWAERPVAELKAFLAVAPHVVAIAAGVAQPQVTASVAGNAVVTNAAIQTHEGKTYEQMEPKEKVALHQSAPEIYAALRNNWEERGKPGSKKA